MSHLACKAFLSAEKELKDDLYRVASGKAAARTRNRKYIIAFEK